MRAAALVLTSLALLAINTEARNKLPERHTLKITKGFEQCEGCTLKYDCFRWDNGDENCDVEACYKGGFAGLPEELFDGITPQLGSCGSCVVTAHCMNIDDPEYCQPFECADILNNAIEEQTRTRATFTTRSGLMASSDERKAT